MPALSKYTNEEVEQLVDQLVAVLAEKKAPVDLSLMCLGNTITHIIKEHVPAAKRAAVAKNFANALTDSLK
ncbi:DUF1414 domain-containing protein [Pseudoalteromonas sp. T1lg10]|uniref:DUF1414 domain-containing protein n=1 Tax=Pseudoalteromonas sp. T1lg10 TaxID=2077093 RepID=UPI000CF6A059|nr:DUF1414 domain-containing protein [Pseudoalteromonas sp. T1lg10]